MPPDRDANEQFCGRTYGLPRLAHASLCSSASELERRVFGSAIMSNYKELIKHSHFDEPRFSL